MAEHRYRYIIVGAGLAGASAVDGIREHDQEGRILLIGAEPFLPYDRPPLTKGLWFGKKQVQDIFVHDDPYYARQHVDLALHTRVVTLDAGQHTVTDQRGTVYQYEKLLLATGGLPRRLAIPGGDLEWICYYRYLDDYLRIRHEAKKGRTAVVIGGGFIGSELSAALTMAGVNVTMLFPDAYLAQRVLPEGLGQAITAHFRQRGVTMLQDVPTAITMQDGRFHTQTKNGQEVVSEMLIAGVGIQPDVELAKQAGLAVGNGIEVNELLQTSHPDIFAAGDNARFPYLALGETRRVEHWDNAVNQGKWAGRNLAGAQQPYDYLPYFFSDLFEFGYEAVGDVVSSLEVFADWQKENDTGVLYYLQDGKVRGVMTCNIYGKLDDARALIRSGRQVKRPDELRGVIRPAKAA